ncbi:MAG TPA: hypothetical protein DCR14_20035 [Acidimicrobiaceae bacterium]|nr:hypothetical protein [Acidimicrobiaceae bacterium]
MPAAHHHHRHRPTPRRLPPPLRNRAEALDLLDIAVQRPLRPETLCIPLDPSGQGASILIASGTNDPDAIFGLVEFMAMSAEGGPTDRLVMASVRPMHDLLPGDVDRWLDASAIAQGFGVLLVEWFVVSPTGVFTPRDLLGEPERWTQ